MSNSTNVKVKKDKVKYDFNLFSIPVLIILLVYSISFIFPLIWGFYNSFKSDYQFSTMSDFFGLPLVSLWQEDLWSETIIRAPETADLFFNYNYIFTKLQGSSRTDFIAGIFIKRNVVHINKYNFFTLITNTLIYAAGTASVFVFCSVCVAYICAKYRYKFSTFLYSFVLITMIIPITSSAAARIELLRNLSIFDSWLGLVINNFGFESMYFLIFYAFFGDLSSTYNEAAEIDGASQFRTMFSICVPLAMKMVSTVILIQFVGAWNEYTSALMFYPTKKTLAVALHGMGQATQGRMSLPTSKMAAMVVLCLPILLLFIFLKDKLMGNISIGGIKE